MQHTIMNCNDHLTSLVSEIEHFHTAPITEEIFLRQLAQLTTLQKQHLTCPLFAGLVARFKTFSRFPFSTPISPLKAACAGLYRAENKADHLRCVYCSGNIGFWDPSDLPAVEHARHFPDCISFKTPRMCEAFSTDVLASGVPFLSDGWTEDGELVFSFKDFSILSSTQPRFCHLLAKYYPSLYFRTDNYHHPSYITFPDGSRQELDTDPQFPSFLDDLACSWFLKNVFYPNTPTVAPPPRHSSCVDAPLCKWCHQPFCKKHALYSIASVLTGDVEKAGCEFPIHCRLFNCLDFTDYDWHSLNPHNPSILQADFLKTVATHQGFGDFISSVTSSVSSALQTPAKVGAACDTITHSLGSVSSAVDVTCTAVSNFTSSASSLLDKISSVVSNLGCNISIARRVTILLMAAVTCFQNPTWKTLSAQTVILLLTCDISTSFESITSWIREYFDQGFDHWMTEKATVPSAQEVPQVIDGQSLFHAGVVSRLTNNTLQELLTNPLADETTFNLIPSSTEEGLFDAVPVETPTHQGAVEDFLFFGKAFSLLLSAVLSLCAVGTLPSITPKCLGDLGRTLTGVRSLSGCLEACLEWLKAYFSPPHDIQNWLEAAALVEGVEEKEIDTNLELVNALVEFGRKTQQWYPSICTRFKNNSTQMGILTRLFDKVMQKFELAQRSPLYNATMRMEPATIYIYGTPGVGKSWMTKLLQSDMLKRVAPDLLESRSLSHNVFSRKSGNEFWDGYAGQFIVQYDDILQLKDSESRPNPEILEIVHAVNTEPYHLHMSSIKDKKDAYFSSKLVVATSNVSMPYSKSCESVHAFNRRWDLAVVLTNPPTHQQMKNGVQVYRADPNASADDTSGYQFHVLDLATGRPTNQALTYAEVLDRLEQAFHDKRQKYDKLRGLHTKQFGIAGGLLNRDTQHLVHLLSSVDFQGDDEDEFTDVDESFAEAFPSQVITPAPSAPPADTDTDFTPPEPITFTEEDVDFLVEDDISPAETERSFLSKCGDLLAGFGLRKILAWAAVIAQVVKCPAHLIYLWEDVAITQAAKLVERALPSHFKHWAVKISGLIFGCAEMALYLGTSLSVADFEGEFLMSKLDFILWRIQAVLFHTFNSENLPNRLHRHILFNSVAWPHASWGTRIRMWLTLLATTDLPYPRSIKKKADTLLYRLGLKIKESGVFIWLCDHPFIKYTLLGLGGLLALAGIKHLFSATKNATSWPQSLYNTVASPDTRAKLAAKQAALESTFVTPASIMSGDHITTRHRSVRHEMMSGDHITRRVHAPRHEGLSDQNAMELAYKVFDNNYVRLSAGGYSMNGVFVRGRTILAPFHFMAVALSRQADIIVTNPGTDVQLVLPIKQVEYQRLKRYNGAETDLCFITHLSLPMRPSLIKHFLNDELSAVSPFLLTARGPRKTLALLPVLSTAVTQTPIPVTSTVDGKPLTTTIHHGLTYRAPTMFGDCGALLMERNTKNATKIFGVHVAGVVQSETGYAEAVTRPFLERNFETFVDKYEMADPAVKHVHTEENHGDFISYGTPDPLPPSQPLKSEIVPSLIQDHYEHRPITKPAALKPIHRAGECIDPMSKGLLKVQGPQSTVDMHYLEQSLAHVFNTIRHPEGRKPRVLSHVESILGIEGLNPINRKTSPGYPWNLQASCGKERWMGSGDEWRVDDQELFEAVESLISSAEKGIRTPVFFTATLKDERRSREKVAAGKTRVFESAPQHYVLGMRRYFGDFIAECMSQRITTDFCVGINPYSLEWEMLARKLTAKGGKVIAGDYSNFDGSQNLLIHRRICDYINSWYDDGHRNAQIRTILWEELCNSFVLVKDKVIQQTHSQPSGNPLTVIINCIYNSMAMRYAWLICEEAALDHGLIEELGGLRAYDLHVAAANYGDDNVLGISDYAIQFYNQDTITKALELIGLTYTDEAKTGVFTPYRHLSDVSFLKRKFVRDETSEYLIWAPLDLAVCREMTLWTRGRDATGEATLENCRVAAMELALHGKTVYDEETTKLNRAIRAAGLTSPIPAYSFYRDFHEKQKLDVALTEGQTPCGHC